MSQYQTAIYTRGDTLPSMDDGNFFHSPELFHIVERTPGQRPCMAVATDEQGRVVGHILVFLLRASWMPLLYWQAHAYGEGDYAEDVNSEEVFGLLLEALVRRLRRRLCFFIEFSDVSRKMFGYKYFRSQGFFPIPWQEIHNSLHSMDPHDRLQPKMLKKIEHAYQQGVETREVTTEEDLDRFAHLVRGFYRWKVHRVVPPEKQIRLASSCNDDRVAGDHLGVETQLCPHLLPRCRAALSQQSVSRVHPSLRWQACGEVPLVPILYWMAQQAALLDMERVGRWL